MFDKYVELTEGPEDRLVKVRPTRGELAGYLQDTHPPQVRFFSDSGRFISTNPDAIVYDPSYLPAEYPSDALLELIASGSRTVTYDRDRRLFEQISEEKWRKYDEELLAAATHRAA